MPVPGAGLSSSCLTQPYWQLKRQDRDMIDMLKNTDRTLWLADGKRV